jgi:hypothetical protein
LRVKRIENGTEPGDCQGNAAIPGALADARLETLTHAVGVPQQFAVFFRQLVKCSARPPALTGCR